MQEDNADAKRNKGSYNVGQLVGEVVGAPPLGNCKGSANNQSVHPAVAQAFLAVQDQDNQQRNKESEERCLVTNDSGNVLCRFEGNRGIAASNHVACGGDGGTSCAIGNRSGVRDEDRQSRLSGLYAQGKDHGCGDGDRSTEAGKCFEQAAEAEGNEDCLDADIAAANNVKQALQVFRASGNNRNLVEPYGHDDDEYDGECAIAGTLQARKGGEVSGHAEGEYCNYQRNYQRNERGNVRFCLYAHQHNEECRERNAGNQGRQGKTACDWIDHSLEHRFLSFE